MSALQMLCPTGEVRLIVYLTNAAFSGETAFIVNNFHPVLPVVSLSLFKVWTVTPAEVLKVNVMYAEDPVTQFSPSGVRR